GDDALDEVHARPEGLGLRAGGAADLDYVRSRAADLLLGVSRRVKDDYLAHVRVAQVHADAVDQHALADMQRRQHRAAGDAIGLDDPRLDREREPQRHTDDDDELEDRAGCRFGPFPTALARRRARTGLGAGAHAGSSAPASPSGASPAS